MLYQIGMSWLYGPNWKWTHFRAAFPFTSRYEYKNNNSRKSHSCLKILIFQINEETDFVELHSVDLDLENIIYTLTKSDTCESIEFASIKPFAKSEIVRIYFKEKLAKGAGILSMGFKGTYPEDEGLYRTACLFRNGKSEFGVCTQFQVDLK